MNPTSPGGASKETLENHIKRQAMLEKPWAEANVEEKLEKVREELIQLSHNTYRVNSLEALMSKFKNHSHQDGKIVAPLANTEEGYAIGGLASRRNNLA